MERKTLGFLVVAIVLLFLLISYRPETKFTSVCFSNVCITAEIADTPAKHSQGLMFREELEENEGMLFVFGSEGIYPFWMKNTHIPLDIIWIDRNSTIVHVEHAVPYTGNYLLYSSNMPAKYVIEIKAGFVENNKINLGDKVSIEL